MNIYFTKTKSRSFSPRGFRPSKEQEVRGNDRKRRSKSHSKPRSRGRSRSRSRGNRRSRSRCSDRSRSRYVARSRGRSRSRSRRWSRDRLISRARSRSLDRLSVRPSSRTSHSTASSSKKPDSERDKILTKWRKNYCHTGQQISDKLEELASTTEDILEKERNVWTRSTPAELFYERDEKNMKIIKATPKLKQLCEDFNKNLVMRAKSVNDLKPLYNPPPRKNRARLCKHKTEVSSSDSSDESLTDEEDCTMEELQRKQQHPDRLHPEMWFNEPGEMNDGPLCRCSRKSKKSGIRHGVYPGESHLIRCNILSNNYDKLYHYRITISPPTNFLIKTPTIIQHDEHEFIFEGFSMFSHHPLEKLPNCKVIRFNIEYTILYIEEKIPENFIIWELDLFTDFLFKEVLELVDLDFKAHDDKDGCPQFHFMPRFVRELPENGKEILCMKEVLQYLLDNSTPLIESNELENMIKMTQYEWQSYADEVKGMVVTYPGKKPCSVRVDQLDRNIDSQKEGEYKFPEIVHFGIRPPQLSYAGNPDYQKAWRDYVKFRHLLANMSKPTYEDKRKLEAKENKLQEMRTQGKMKRDVTVAVSAEGFYRTGIMCDIIQHAMLIPVLVCHLRFHHSLNVLEETINYKFMNRALLQLALTHPSYRENFGTNPDHARNSLTNCGIRQPEYGDRRIHYLNTRKREYQRCLRLLPFDVMALYVLTIKKKGSQSTLWMQRINTLINIMSRFGKQFETESNITHNERLEFLGDAVVEFLSSIHLFYSFPDLEEGGLATYRAAIVQNQHLSVLAHILKLDQFMLYAHGSDLCHDLELRHAMANCFEALMGALFLDGGIEVADNVFSATFFHDKQDLYHVWVNLPPHPLQEQEPLGDRQWVDKFEILQNLIKFETSINVEFKHIRLLARAFTDRSVGYTNLTMGSNQRLEFLGDTVLQLIASEYLYKFFPEHHEGHLSLLRSSLVNNRTQAVVCDDLDMSKYAIYNNPKAELKTKDRADLLEAFIGALYVDQGMEFCEVFCQVTLFPRLQDFIMNQDWNDPKSKLQQCCLTLRTMDGGEPDIPVYRVIECKGPTNTRVYTVAVYFREKRLASAMGHSIQQAEMNAAKKALEISQDLFPQLDHQKRVIAKSMKRQKRRGKSCSRMKNDLTSKSPENSTEKNKKECRSPENTNLKSKLPSKNRKSRSSSRSKIHKESKPKPIRRSRSRDRRKSRSQSYNSRTKSCKNSGSKADTRSRSKSSRPSNTKVSRRSNSGERPRSKLEERCKKTLEKRRRSKSCSRSRSNSRGTRSRSKSRRQSNAKASRRSNSGERPRSKLEKICKKTLEKRTRSKSRSRFRSNSSKRARSKSVKRTTSKPNKRSRSMSNNRLRSNSSRRTSLKPNTRSRSKSIRSRSNSKNRSRTIKMSRSNSDIKDISNSNMRSRSKLDEKFKPKMGRSRSKSNNRSWSNYDKRTRSNSSDRSRSKSSKISRPLYKKRSRSKSRLRSRSISNEKRSNSRFSRRSRSKSCKRSRSNSCRSWSVSSKGSVSESSRSRSNSTKRYRTHSHRRSRSNTSNRSRPKSKERTRSKSIKRSRSTSSVRFRSKKFSRSNSRQHNKSRSRSASKARSHSSDISSNVSKLNPYHSFN